MGQNGVVMGWKMVLERWEMGWKGAASCQKMDKSALEMR